jgi:ATP-binding cassette, subfamily G (WHITE), member 2, PDR
MYRVNPFTYIIESFMGTSLGNAPMHCAANEFVRFTAPDNLTCAEYALDYLSRTGGYLADPEATACEYCSMSETNQFLASVSISYKHRWRDFGFMWVFCLFNLCMAFLFYWLARVPKRKAKGD